MSTSDQNGEQKLTRKQLRELRLTGSTPVITEEEAAANAAPPSPLPRAAEPARVAPAPRAGDDVDPEHEPLTRRGARAQERVRTAAVPVFEPQAASTTQSEPEAEPEAAAQSPIVSTIPSFAPAAAQPAKSAESVESVDEPEPEPTEAVEVEVESQEAQTEAEAEAEPESETAAEADGRATVNSAFGRGVGQSAPGASIPQLFDDIIEGDGGGSQHTAPNAIIFNPAPGSASLSGPVASTGELLITGSYDLPQGLGSQGHAHGTTDGKDVDAVLIDGELPPASSPTPIAASSAVSTSKPAGEVIRPPAPEKGNRLMLTLAIVAGGLAIALAAVIVVAINTNVFG